MYGTVYFGNALIRFLEQAMRNHPGVLKETFELLYFNDDILHPSWIESLLKNYEWKPLNLASLDDLNELIAKAPMFQFSSDISKDPSNWYAFMERNKFVIPDAYALLGDFCKLLFPDAKLAQDAYPWDSKIEKAFFIGKPTGFNNDFFPFGVGKSITHVRDTILTTPFAFQRGYVALHMAQYFPEFVEASLAKGKMYHLDRWILKMKPIEYEEQRLAIEQEEGGKEFLQLVGYIDSLDFFYNWRHTFCALNGKNQHTWVSQMDGINTQEFKYQNFKGFLTSIKKAKKNKKAKDFAKVIGLTKMIDNNLIDPKFKDEVID